MRGLLMMAAAVGALLTGPAAAQNYPAQPVRMVVGFAPGGGMDTIARLVSDKLAAPLGQQVVVDNRPGAGGTLAAAYVANERADGYTIILTETSALIGPVVYGNVGYDPIESFVPVANLTQAPLALVAHPSFAANSMAEFIELAKSKPGEFFYATPGKATTQHLAVEMLEKAAGLDLQDAPFQGGAPSVTAVVSGEVPLAIVSLSAAVAQAQGGKIKILGITTAERIPDFPDIPTIGETVKGFSALPSNFLAAPAKTPPEALAALSKAVETAMQDKSLTDALAKQGLLPVYKNGEALKAEIPEQTQIWTDAYKAVGQ